MVLCKTKKKHPFPYGFLWLYITLNDRWLHCPSPLVVVPATLNTITKSSSISFKLWTEDGGVIDDLLFIGRTTPFTSQPGIVDRLPFKIMKTLQVMMTVVKERLRTLLP